MIEVVKIAGHVAAFSFGVASTLGAIWFGERAWNWVRGKLGRQKFQGASVSWEEVQIKFGNGRGPAFDLTRIHDGEFLKWEESIGHECLTCSVRLACNINCADLGVLPEHAGPCKRLRLAAQAPKGALCGACPLWDAYGSRGKCQEWSRDCVAYQIARVRLVGETSASGCARGWGALHDAMAKITDGAE